MHELQGKISMEMTSYFYNKKEEDWIGVFHGSTLNKGNKSIMLTGESGSGKSSLTLILSSNGFSLIADDFSPISNEMKHYKFPGAISVKKGFYSYANKLSKNFIKKEEYVVDKKKGKFKYFSLDIDNTLNSHNCNYIIDVKEDDRKYLKQYYYNEVQKLYDILGYKVEEHDLVKESFLTLFEYADQTKKSKRIDNLVTDYFSSFVYLAIELKSVLYIFVEEN